LPLQGETARFAARVKRYSGDITSGAILTELLRAGAAKVTTAVFSSPWYITVCPKALHVNSNQ